MMSRFKSLKKLLIYLAEPNPHPLIEQLSNRLSREKTHAKSLLIPNPPPQAGEGVNPLSLRERGREASPPLGEGINQWLISKRSLDAMQWNRGVRNEPPLIPLHYIKATQRHQRGFSYAEVLLSIMLIAILIVPAMQALNAAIRGGSNCIAERQLLLRNKMEEVLSKPFGKISAMQASNNTGFSDPSDSRDSCNVIYRRFVFLSIDGTGLVKVMVYYQDEGSTNALNTLVGKWW